MVQKAYFDDVSQEHPAYFAGLLLADGYRTRGYVAIDLKEPDRHVLDQLCEELELDNDVRVYSNAKSGFRANYPRARLVIYDYDIAARLLQLNVIDRKSSHLAKVPPIPASSFHHWVRGYMDGNGGPLKADVGNHRRTRFNLRGNEPFLADLLPRLPGNLRLRRDGVRSQMYTLNAADGLLVGDWMYKDHTVCLHSKWERYCALTR